MDKLISAKALLDECNRAKESAALHGREFCDSFHNSAGTLSTEWWKVEDMVENAKPVTDVISVSWIEAYADWLLTIPAPFAANDERSIRAMLAKWKTNPDLPQVGCSEDACEIGG